MAGAKLADRNLERAAIKLICTGSPSAKKLLRKIDDSYFHNSVNKLVYKRIMSSLKKTNEIISWRALTHDTALPEAARDALAGYKEKVVVNKQRCDEVFNQMHIYRRRRLLDQVARFINEKQLESSYDDEAILQEAATLLTQARAKKGMEKPLVFGKGANYKQVLEKVFSGEALPTIPTGFAAWDKINGGIVGKSVTLIQGFTGSMKSTLAEVLSCNLADAGARVGQMSLEMSQEETLIRRAARLSRIDQTEILKAKLNPKEQELIERRLERQNKQWRKIGACVHTHTPKNGVSEDELFLSMEIFGYDVLVIDYVSLVKGLMDGNDFWKKLMAFTARAKQFANATDCRVIILVQSTKDNEMKLSTNMANDADLIWSIKFDEEFKTNLHMLINTTKARKQNPIDFPLKKEGQFASIENAEEGTVVQIAGKMNVKNKKDVGSKAFEDGDAIQTRGSKEGRRKSLEDTELEDYFSTAAIE